MVISKTSSSLQSSGSPTACSRGSPRTFDEAVERDQQAGKHTKRAHDVDLAKTEGNAPIVIQTIGKAEEIRKV
jgi:hypothetical protein